MKKKAQIGQLVGGLVIAAVIVIGMLMAAGIVPPPKLGSVVAGENTGDNVCTGGNTQSFTLKAADGETGAANTENFSYRKVGDISWTEGTLGTALTTLEVGADYEFVVGPSPTSEQADPYGPYVRVNNLPCRATKEVKVLADSIYSDITATFYNADNNAAAQSIEASASPQWVHVKLAAASNEVAGNPFLATAPIGDNGNHRMEYPNAGCFALNSSLFDDAEMWYNGVEMNRISAPTIYSGTTGATSYCFEMPVLTENELFVDIKIDPDDTLYANSDHDATLNIYTGSFFINSKNANLQWGVETDDGNFVQFSQADTVTIDLT